MAVDAGCGARGALAAGEPGLPTTVGLAAVRDDRPAATPAARLAAACAALLAALACLLLLAGCGDADSRARSQIEQGIEDDMARLQSLSDDDAATIFASDYTTELSLAGVSLAAVYGPMFSSLSYTVDDISVSGDEAAAALTVTNKDLTAALQNYTEAVTSELATSESREALAALSEEELVQHLAEVLEECLNDAGLPLVTTQVTLQYVKDGNSWSLSNSADLARALLGGLDADAVAGTASGVAAADAADASDGADAASADAADLSSAAAAAEAA